ncbi:MAG TPA: Gfo/Idh/MocA family oxidoreductase [Lacisediminihabitans sp.]|uniref:Gfo/Idh/MocA family protein n=1 Tax=Lacisediminihabitans sp. TaxID=2787631 RepID=UPI002ED89DAD
MSSEAAGAPIRAGFIGAGFMAEVHSRAVRAARGLPYGIASSTAEGAARAADRLGIVRSYETAEQLIADPDIDVIHVCTPNTSHAGYASAAIAAGKNVVCEKPLATSVPDAERLVAEASVAGVTATVPFVYRFHPMVREARARVAAGELGRLLTIDGSYLQDWLLLEDDDNWRVRAESGGPSRAFADIGSHLCDLVEFVTGDRIRRLTATTRTFFPARSTSTAITTEDAVAVVVETRGGALGTLLVSQVAPGRKNRLAIEIAGTNESIGFDQEQPESLWLGHRVGSQLVMRDGATLSPDAARLSVLPAGHPLGYQDAFTAFVADSYAAIAGGVPDGLPRFEDGARAARITEAVLRSADEGRWIDLEEESAR